MTKEEIIASLTESQREALTGDILDAGMNICFELVNLELVDWETNVDDDMFFWLTDLGKEVQEVLQRSLT